MFSTRRARTHADTGYASRPAWLKAPNGGLEIGTFQLVPVAYIPPTPPPPPPPLQLLVPPSPSLDTDHAIGDAETIPAPPPAVLPLPPSTLSTDSVKSTFEGDNRGRAGFSGCFMSGVIVGVVAIVSMTWLMLARGWGRGKWEGLMNGAGRREGGRKKASSDLKMSLRRMNHADATG